MDGLMDGCIDRERGRERTKHQTDWWSRFCQQAVVQPLHGDTLSSQILQLLLKNPGTRATDSRVSFGIDIS